MPAAPGDLDPSFGGVGGDGDGGSGGTDPVPGNDRATATTAVNNARGCTVIGTRGADPLNGGFFTDVICGLGGNDTIRPGYGHDTANGGLGTDTGTTDPGDARISCPQDGTGRRPAGHTALLPAGCPRDTGTDARSGTGRRNASGCRCGHRPA